MSGSKLIVARIVWLSGVVTVGYFMMSCGGGGGPAQQATRTAVYVIEALCQPSMTVEECSKVLEERAGFLDQLLDAGKD